MRWGIFHFGEDHLFCSSTLKPAFRNWSCVWFGLSPQKWESKHWSLGAVVLGSVCSSFWICSGLLRASSSSVLRQYREVTLSAILCFILQVLCSVLMDFIYIHPLWQMICAECLSLRGYVVGCLQAVGIAHLSIQTGFSPFLTSRQIFLIIQRKMCEMSFRFSHQQWFIFALSTSTLFMLQVIGVLGIYIRLLIWTANQLLLDSSFSTGFGIIPASFLWGGKKTCILGALLRLFQPPCSFPRNFFQTAPAQKSMCHILLLVKCSVLLSVLTGKDLSQFLISLSWA